MSVRRAGEPLRVLHLLPDFDLGGGQVILLRTIEAMTDGFEHLVVGFGEGPMLERYRDAGIRCEIVVLDGPASYPGALRSLVRTIRRERIDVLHNLNTPLDRTLGQAAALLTRKPFVIWFMSIAIPRLPFPPPPSRALAWAKRWVLWPLNMWSVRRAAGLMALSDAVARSFADHLSLETTDFDLVRPGLEVEVFDRRLSAAAADDLALEVGVAGASPILLCVGMLIDLKGQQELVPMMEQLREDLPNAHLLLVGEGENRTGLEQAIADGELADRVTLLGHRTDVPDLLQMADGFISASNSEGFGMAVLEAMAAGLPVVAVRLPAIEEFAVDGETAVLVDSQDATQLADGVRRVFAAEGVAASMGEAGRKHAGPRTTEATAETAGAVYRRVAGDRAALAPSADPLDATRSTARRLGRLLPRRRTGSSEFVVAAGPAAGLRLGLGRASSDYRDGSAELPVQEALANAVRPGSIVYDIGANVGFFSLIAARRAGPEGRVIAFEPLSENAEAIRRNAERNGFGTIEVREVALDDHSGPVELLLADHPGGATIEADSPPPDLRGSEMVTGASIDDLIAFGDLAAPDVVKIDVEGAEERVLAGMAGLIAEARPVIICEFDDVSPARVEEKRAEFEETMTAHGYTVRRLPDSYDNEGWQVVHVLAEPR